jgi:hypothetical protein
VGVQSIQEYVGISQLRWYGHVSRMDDKGIVKRVYEASETGKNQGDDQGKHGRKGYKR